MREAVTGLVVALVACTPVDRSVGDLVAARLTVNPLGPGSGRVVLDPPGSACDPPCNADYRLGTRVTLQADALDGSFFREWTNDCAGSHGACVLTMSATRAAGADFALQRPAVIVEGLGSGSGTITSSPAGVSGACRPACVQEFPHGTTLTLFATANPDTPFAGWVGPCSGLAPRCAFTVVDPVTVGAHFAGACSERAEVCDGADNNCNGRVDEGLAYVERPAELPIAEPFPIHLAAMARAGERLLVAWTGGGSDVGLQLTDLDGRSSGGQIAVAERGPHAMRLLGLADRFVLIGTATAARRGCGPVGRCDAYAVEVSLDGSTGPLRTLTAGRAWTGGAAAQTSSAGVVRIWLAYTTPAGELRIQGSRLDAPGAEIDRGLPATGPGELASVEPAPLGPDAIAWVIERAEGSHHRILQLTTDARGALATPPESVADPGALHAGAVSSPVLSVRGVLYVAFESGGALRVARGVGGLSPVIVAAGAGGAVLATDGAQLFALAAQPSARLISLTRLSLDDLSITQPAFHEVGAEAMDLAGVPGGVVVAEGVFGAHQIKIQRIGCP